MAVVRTHFRLAVWAEASTPPVVVLPAFWHQQEMARLAGWLS